MEEIAYSSWLTCSRFLYTQKMQKQQRCIKHCTKVKNKIKKERITDPIRSNDENKERQCNYEFITVQSNGKILVTKMTMKKHDHDADNTTYRNEDFIIHL
jgi:hypothetical protein